MCNEFAGSGGTGFDLLSVGARDEHFRLFIWFFHNEIGVWGMNGSSTWKAEAK